jgi:hypothetical protein
MVTDNDGKNMQKFYFLLFPGGNNPAHSSGNGQNPESKATERSHL